MFVNRKTCLSDRTFVKLSLGNFSIDPSDQNILKNINMQYELKKVPVLFNSGVYMSYRTIKNRVGIYNRMPISAIGKNTHKENLKRKMRI